MPRFISFGDGQKGKTKRCKRNGFRVDKYVNLLADCGVPSCRSSLYGMVRLVSLHPLELLLLVQGFASAATANGGGGGSAAAVVAGSVVLETALAKPDPTSPWLGGSSSLSLLSAKNEYESFLVVLSGPLDQVTVAPPPFAQATARAMVFAARYVHATKPSGCLGKSGLTLDPLVPDTDVFNHEQRNAFPLDVPAGQSRVVWVDVFTPADAPAGTVSAPVVVQHGKPAERAVMISLTVSLTVLSFALPSTPSMVSLFGFGGTAVVQQAHATGPYHAAKLVDKYVQAGLANRVSHADWLARGDTQGQLAAANQTNGSSTASGFAQWAAAHASKYDGMDVPGPGGQASLRGARLTSAQLPTPFCTVHPNRSGFIKKNCSTAELTQQIAYWRQMHAAWETRGWAHLLFDYTIDEPGCFSQSGQPVAWETLKETVRWVKQAHPSLRSLVTVDMGHARNGDVTKDIDIWVPLINDLWPKEFSNGSRVCHPQSVGINGVGQVARKST